MTLGALWLVVMFVSLVYLLVVVVRTPPYAQMLAINRWAAVPAFLLALALILQIVLSLVENELAYAALAGAGLVILCFLIRWVVTSRRKHTGVR